LTEQKATTSVLLEKTRVFTPPKDLVKKSNVMKWMKSKGFTTEMEMCAWTGQNFIAFWDEMVKSVNKLANCLKSLGVNKDDQASIIHAHDPQRPIAMLACTKIDAIHSVVFSGSSSAGGLNSRVLDAESKVVITTEGFFRRGKSLSLKPSIDGATANTLICQEDSGQEGRHQCAHEGKDVWHHDLVAKQSDICESEKMDSEDRSFILYYLENHWQAQGYRACPWQILCHLCSDPRMGLRYQGQ
jgi:acyl-coenzyme A synthetase/AMP-(fatty) acid ligase